MSDVEVTLRAKTIDDVLNISVKEGTEFFKAEPTIGKKIEVLNDLGLGYLTLGQSAATLSGSEVVVTGTPEQVAVCKRSHTERFLKEHL